MAYPFLGGGVSYGNGVCALGKVIYTFKIGGSFSSGLSLKVSK